MTIKSEEQNHPPALGGAFWSITPSEDFLNNPLNRGAKAMPHVKVVEEKPP